MGKLKDLTGQKFGRLLVLSLEKGHGTRIHFKCKCDCGNTPIVASGNLLAGMSTNCGCKRKETLSRLNKIHGKIPIETYDSWENMKRRCLNKTNKAYLNYGGRGIKICFGWKDFKNFREDLGKRPSRHTLDRINNDGHYSCGHCEECVTNCWPMNCRWTTHLEQNRNRRSNRWLEAFGKKMIISDWSKELSIERGVLRKNLKKKSLTEIIIAKRPTYHKKQFCPPAPYQWRTYNSANLKAA